MTHMFPVVMARRMSMCSRIHGYAWLNVTNSRKLMPHGSHTLNKKKSFAKITSAECKYT